MDKQTEQLIKDIDELLERFRAIKEGWQSSTSGEGRFNDRVGYSALSTEALTLISYIYGNDHIHSDSVRTNFDYESLYHLQVIEGIFKGTKNILRKGLLGDLRGKVIIEIKTDFLDSAKEFIEEGHKDPAAVLACVVLEDSLKRLAALNGIEDAKDQEMSVVVGLLLKNGIIEKSTVGAIASFKPLRNAALHAEWDHVDEGAVRMLINYLPSFIDKHGI